MLQITSSVPEEGKSSLALALALTQANAGKRVLLVDADLRRGGIGKRLGHDIEAPGLTDLILAEDMDIDAHVTALGDTGLDFMRSGDARQANATDIFSSQRMGQIIGALRSRYDRHTRRTARDGSRRRPDHRQAGRQDAVRGALG